MPLKKITIFVLITIIIVFIIQNMAMVEIQFLFWSLALPRSVILMVVFMVGALAGWFYKSLSSHQHREE